MALSSADDGCICIDESISPISFEPPLLCCAVRFCCAVLCVFVVLCCAFLLCCAVRFCCAVLCVGCVIVIKFVLFTVTSN
jgi:hypothetical protein